MKRLIEQHRSPDGSLTFIVWRQEDGDLCLGFEGYPWHTHADILSSISGLNEEEAIRLFIDDLVNSKAVIAINQVGEEIQDVWVADEAVPDKYRTDDESIEFRFWDGKAAM